MSFPNVSQSGIAFERLPGFTIFQDLVRENIGYLPDFSIDSVSASGHRVRAFDEPPSADVRFSERALARYIRHTDIVFGALKRQNTDFICNMLCAEAGAEYLLVNRFQGLAMLAQGFQHILIKRLSTRESLEAVMEQSQDPRNEFSLISILLPLGHEFGHLPQAQAFCPPQVMGEEFLETLRINYDRAVGFSGSFDYCASLEDPSSPIHLATLREEIAADYFATCTLATMFAKISQGSAFPLKELSLGLLIFPMAMALELTSRPGKRSIRVIQETTLAMHCRQSVLLDAVRGCVKSFFVHSKGYAEIAELIESQTGEVFQTLDALQDTVWEGVRKFYNVQNEFSELNVNAVLSRVRELIPHGQQQIYLGNYVAGLLGEVDPYPLSKENEASLLAFSNRLLTFDTIVIGEDYTRLIRN